jgi:protein involved in polysaccharide export with SLBB domain
VTLRRHNPRFAARRGGNALAAWLIALSAVLLAGCASVTNPVANGLPVRMLPEELKAETREGFEQIPLTLLRQPPPADYILEAGDTLGIYIEGIIGTANTPPPVNIPDIAELPPSIGYPIPIREDGTISLPIVGAITVAGDTIEKAELRVIKAYVDREILTTDRRPILLTLMRPRSVRVLVVREDSSQQQVSLRNESLLGLGTTETTIGGGRRSVGQVLELPAYENDVLNALARTGGLPGLESTQEIIIQRGYWNPRTTTTPSAAEFPLAQPAEGENAPHVIRIPLRVRPGDALNINPEDVILQNGDIVTIRGREPAFFYTGGLLPSGEYPLPMDYDLTVVEAVLKVRGPLLNGGLNASNLNGAIVGAGIGNPSPNLLTVLRKTPGDGQVMIRVDIDEAVRDPRQNILVQQGDILILQEAPDQALARYFSTIFRGDFFVRWLDRNDAQGTGSVAVP